MLLFNSTAAEKRRVFDSPFFGANVFIPMIIAAILAGLLAGRLHLAWYWDIPVIVLCFVVVFGASLWWDSRD